MLKVLYCIIGCTRFVHGSFTGWYRNFSLLTECPQLSGGGRQQAVLRTTSVLNERVVRQNNVGDDTSACDGQHPRPQMKAEVTIKYLCVGVSVCGCVHAPVCVVMK